MSRIAVNSRILQVGLVLAITAIPLFAGNESRPEKKAQKTEDNRDSRQFYGRPAGSSDVRRDRRRARGPSTRRRVSGRASRSRPRRTSGPPSRRRRTRSRWSVAPHCRPMPPWQQPTSSAPPASRGRSAVGDQRRYSGGRSGATRLGKRDR